MISLEEKIARLPLSHRRALLWFSEHQGQEIQWPRPMPDGIFLANKANGVHKPASWEYALSVRQLLNVPCHEPEPVMHADGSWTCHYCEEQSTNVHHENIITNLPLLACQQDEIPVGVLRQIKEKPVPRYQILGLALVRQWKSGCFLLEGFGRSGVISVRASDAALTFRQVAAKDKINDASIEDAHRRIIESIALRQGEEEFRALVLTAYGNRCAISDCDVPFALDAAYAFRYIGTGTHTVTNGILLRSDLHILYDLGLIAIDPFSLKIVTAPTLKNSDYDYLGRMTLRLPLKMEQRPNRAALEMHLMWAKTTWK